MYFQNKELTEALNQEAEQNFCWSDLIYDIDLTSCTSYDEIWEAIEKDVNDNNRLNDEFYYYASAIEYLMNNDPSLNESLSLAHELGYTTDNINSCLLANLLSSEENRETLHESEEDIKSIFERFIEDEEICPIDLTEEEATFLAEFDCDKDFLKEGEVFNLIETEDIEIAEILLSDSQIFEESDLYKIYTKSISTEEIENLQTLYDNHYNQSTAINLILAPMLQ